MVTADSRTFAARPGGALGATVHASGPPRPNPNASNAKGRGVRRSGAAPALRFLHREEPEIA